MISPAYLAKLIEAHAAKQAERDATSVSQLDVDREVAGFERAA